MSAAELKPFHELEYHDTPCLLEWIGGIHHNFDDPGNPLIECLFTPLRQNPNKALPDLIRINSDQFRAGFAVGYLPSLFIGQIYQERKSVDCKGGPAEDIIELVVNLDEEGSVRETSQSEMRGTLNSNLHFGDSIKAGLKEVSGTLISTTNKRCPQADAAPDRPYRYSVLIPEIELIRFYYAKSEHFSKALFRGAFEENKLLTQVINALHEDPYLDEEEKRARFVYRHGFKQSDVVHLGRVIFSPTALSGAQRIKKSTIVQQINDSNQPYTYPRTDFPFGGVTTLRLSGKVKKISSRQFVFLVHRILGCSGSFPFKHLSCSDELTPGGASAGPDAPVAFPNQNREEVGPNAADHDVGESRSDERSSAASKPLEAVQYTGEFSGLEGVVVVFEKLRDCSHRSSEPRVPLYRDDLRNASTGDGTSGQTTSVKQNIVDVAIVRRNVSASLKSFVDALRALQELRPEWLIETKDISRGGKCDVSPRRFPDDPEIAFSEFPPVSCAVRKQTDRQFSFMDQKKTRARRLVCAKVEVSGLFFYLMDAERREREALTEIQRQTNDRYMEDFPILLLYSADYRELLPEDFSTFLIATVKKKTWPNQNLASHLKRARTPHGTGSQSTGDIARRMMHMLEERLPVSTHS